MKRAPGPAGPRMRFTGRRVYLTGGTGFIGGAVALRLREEGAELTCLVRPGTPAHRLEAMGARVVRGDVTDPATLDLSGQHVVVHAAAWVAYGVPPTKVALFRRTNVDGTQNVVEAAERAGVGKLVHVSSIAAVGPTPRGMADESAPLREAGGSEYERAKTEAHRLALKARVPVALPMPGLVLGPEGPFEPVLRAVAKRRVPALPGDDAVKGWTHVEDVAEGVLLCALRGLGPYLLVDENARFTELLVAALEEAGLPIPRWRFRTGLLVAAGTLVERAYHLRERTPPFSGELLERLRVPMAYDSAHARKDLGWRPELVRRLAEDLERYARA